ncbi:COX2 oxidase, partial [Passerina amoena]|nr:COX2 oxidase [Passerina amoena]NXP83614.1 COX2 oxidase [Passerina amoena]
MANHSQLNFQDASSPIIEELIGFHDHALMVALAICSLVLYLLKKRSTGNFPTKVGKQLAKAG